MSIKNFTIAMTLGLATYLGAGALINDINSPKGSKASKTPDAREPTTDKSTTTAGTSKTTLAQLASSGGGVNAAKTKKLSPDAVPARFVQLNLNADDSPFISGRAPRGSSVTAMKGETTLGKTKTRQNGTWAIGLTEPIADKAYKLVLKTRTQDGSTVVGESAQVFVDQTGFADIKILPAPKPAKPTQAKAQTVATNTAAGTTVNPTKSTSRGSTSGTTAASDTDQKAKPETTSTASTATTIKPAPTANATKAVDAAKDSTTDFAKPAEGGGLVDGILDQATKIANAATEKFTDIVGTDGDKTTPTPGNTASSNTNADANKAATSSASADTKSAPANVAVAVTRSVIRSTPEGEAVMELAGTSTPGAELGIFVDQKRIAGTIAKSDGSWDIKNKIAKGTSVAQLAVKEFDSRGSIISSTPGLAKVASGASTTTATDRKTALPSKSTKPTKTVGAKQKTARSSNEARKRKRAKRRLARRIEAARKDRVRRAERRAARNARARKKTASRTRRSRSAATRPARTAGVRVLRLNRKRTSGLRTAPRRNGKARYIRRLQN